MHTILLVEDDPDQRRLRTLILEKSGYRVLPVDGAGAAMECAQSERPHAVLMDLRLPEAAHGRALIRHLADAHPGVPVIVLSGWPEDLSNHPEHALVHSLMKKPVRSAALMNALRAIGLWLVLLLVGHASALAQSKDFPFTVPKSAETLAAIHLSAPGASWGKKGAEAAVAEIQVDGGPSQHVVVWDGPTPRDYRVFLGKLPPGPHTLKVRRDIQSAPGAKLEILGAKFSSTDNPVVAHAPILYARSNTIGQFSDIPLLVYCERGRDGNGPWISYSVIFSNEDGGTSTRDLMARWGRTTDIEFVYKVWLKPDGAPGRTLIQTKGHKEIPYDGAYQDFHPVLMPVTDNNMVEPAKEGASALRFQLDPRVINLSEGSREIVMDADPATYAISTAEMRRENKLRPQGGPRTISDPRRYLVIEADLQLTDAVAQFLVRPKGSDTWFASAVGLPENFIPREGWVRVAVELPEGTREKGIDSIAIECVVPRKPNERGGPEAGTCLLQRFGKVFFLGADDRPARPLAMPAPSSAGWRVPAGQMRIFPVP